MRVLQICEPADGGAAVNATELSMRLSRRGFDVEYAGPPEARRYTRLREAGIRVHPMPLAPAYFNTRDDVAAMRALNRLLRSGEYDLVHLHSAKAGVLGRLAAARCRTRVVYSPHNFPFMGDHSRVRVRVATSIERRLAALTDMIVCVCEWERRLAISRRIAPEDRLRVIHNGCDSCDGSIPVDATLETMKARGPVAGAIAGLRQFKGIEDLIDAAPAVLEQVPDASLAIIGDGPLGEQLQEQAKRLGLLDTGRVAFIGFSEPACRYLRALDVYVLPSWLEAFPIGILEALACGVPQVATDVGGTGEAVSPTTGTLVPPKRPEMLGAAIADLLADPERRVGMATASRARHEESFRAETMADRTAELYEELARAR